MPLPINSLVPPLLIVLLLVPSGTARAVIVFEKGKDQPTAGRLERQDQRSIVIRETFPDGGQRSREIPRSQIEDILVTVSQDRLERLDPKQPADYRDYAEELAEKRKDPDALDMSLRLYLIAAYLAPKRLGRSSLLGMVALARTAEEESRFRATAFLLDPDHDPNLLKRNDSANRQARLPDERARNLTLKAIQTMRRGDRSTARNRAKSPQVKETLDFYADVMAYDEFMDIQEPIPPQVLYRLLTLELLLSAEQGGDDDAGDRNPAAWSKVVSRDGTTPVRWLSLQTLTEFDPRECLYRDGSWQEPDAVLLP